MTPGQWQTEPFPYGFQRDLSPMNATRIYSNDPGPENDFTIGYAVDVDRPTREAHAKLFAASPEMANMLKGLLSEDVIPYTLIRDLLTKAGVKL